MTRRAARWSKVWWLTPLATGLFLALVVEAAWLPDTMRYLGCATDGEVIDGSVVQAYRRLTSYGGSLRYTYQVDAIDYQGIGKPGHGNAVPTSIGPAKVTYVRAHPDVSCLGYGWTTLEIARNRTESGA